VRTIDRARLAELAEAARVAVEPFYGHLDELVYGTGDEDDDGLALYDRGNERLRPIVERLHYALGSMHGDYLRELKAELAKEATPS
jgi:hypothetical protein